MERFSRPDEKGPLTDKQRKAVVANIFACAPTFEEFVYRWWLEGTIYMKVNGFDDVPLTKEESHYLSHYQQGLFTE